jgi:epoxyqueuosine reductase
MQSLSSTYIKEEARKLGFSDCRIAKAEDIGEEKHLLAKWLQKAYQGEMKYLETQFEKRTNPFALVKNLKSIVVCSLHYASSTSNNFCGKDYKISRYAFGEDYHIIVKEKLRKLISLIKEKEQTLEAKIFVDSGPSMDKVWAKKSGLGWQGKNTCIIHPQYGSFFFIGTIYTNLDLSEDKPIEEKCGSCRKCIDACPTQAITEDFTVNATKCISYLNKEATTIPEAYREKVYPWIFGCDICQEVCPWNQKTEVKIDTVLIPNKKQLSLDKENWEKMTKAEFVQLFGKTPLNWQGFDKIKQTIASLSEK